jgi:acetyl esterase/lipase
MPERLLHYPENVSVSTDITYSTIVGYRPVTLDLYRVDTAEPRPLVIYVHGGAWMIGNPRELGAFNDVPSVLAGLSARGYVVASLEYRLAGEAPFPAAIDDVRSAIRFLRAHAEEYGIDKDRVAIWGASAGAQLASLAALDCGHAPDGADRSNAEESDCVQAGVTWYGLFDFSDLPVSSTTPAVNAYLDCTEGECDPSVVSSASPINHVDDNDPPMLVIHGDADQTVSIEQSRELARRLNAAGVPVTFTTIPGVGHGWKGADGLATQEASKVALEMTYRFLDEQLRTEHR